jgi:TolB protein
MKIKSKPVSKLVIYLLVVFIVVNIAATAYLMWPVLEHDVIQTPSPTNLPPTQTPTFTATATEFIPTQEPTETLTPTPEPPTPTPTQVNPSVRGLEEQGTMILSLADGEYYHLFAFHPQYLPLLRLTDGQSDDINPSVSPDGTKIAFSSRRNGFWDIYILDLKSSQLTQMTKTLEFEGSPTWSPDGQWIAYESYANGNFDIYLADVTHLEQKPLQLTNDPAADFSPVWMPGATGRQIAFVSDRSGEDDIWVARLDDFKERFINISRDSENEDTHPAWSPDGRYIAWAKKSGGDSNLVIWDSQNSEQAPRPIGTGDWPIWNPTGTALLSRVRQANLTAVTSYDSTSGQIVLPLVRLPGPLQGLDWKSSGLEKILATKISQAPTNSAPPLWTTVLSKNPLPTGPDSLVMLDGISAPNPTLLNSVVDSFTALRNKVASETGWDFLNSLESAFAEKGSPPFPGMGNSWLNTGRGINVNQLPLSSGWMALAREDLGNQTYWRIFLKTRAQDGSQGRPITGKTWDILSRNSGDPIIYENGGKESPAPEGYWVDFTELASRYGWDRFPALTNWVTFYPGARFNLFAFTENLDIYTALGQMYPGEDFARPVQRPTLTALPTLKPIEPTETPKAKE